jgi:hypothetical protein
MTFGQVDPARLKGEALRQWYLRTPYEIEAERAAASEAAYSDFFSQPGSGAAFDFEIATRGLTAPAPEKLRAVWSSASIGPDQEYRTGGGGPLLPKTEGRAGHYVQLAATSPSFWDYWSPRGCENCHGYTPDTLPPVGGQSPFPFGRSTRDGGRSGEGSSQPERRDKKECDLQLDSDSQICGRLPSPGDVAICRGTATERYAYCRRPGGTIGFPRLETRGGRRR